MSISQKAYLFKNLLFVRLTNSIQSNESKENRNEAGGDNFTLGVWADGEKEMQEKMLQEEI